MIYTVFLFIKVGGILLYRWLGGTDFSTPVVESEFLRDIYNFLAGDPSKAYGAGDTTILIVLLISAIAVFVIFVAKNDTLVHWLAHQKRNADLTKSEDVIERAKRLRELEAESTRK